jgi:hypothetical protein
MVECDFALECVSSHWHHMAPVESKLCLVDWKCPYWTRSRYAVRGNVCMCVVLSILFAYFFCLIDRANVSLIVMLFGLVLSLFFLSSFSLFFRYLTIRQKFSPFLMVVIGMGRLNQFAIPLCLLNSISPGRP